MKELSGSSMRTLTMRGSPVADAPEGRMRDEAPWLPSQLAGNRSVAQLTLLISMGAGTGGAHAEMFLKSRSPAAFASVTRSVRPGVSTGNPFAFENPEKKRTGCLDCPDG